MAMKTKWLDVRFSDMANRKTGMDSASAEELSSEFLASLTDEDIRRLLARQKFSSLVANADSNGCTVWIGPRSSQDGYGRFYDGSHENRFAHAIAYEAHHGEVPPGLVIDHLCRNRACVNALHLEAVTQQVNTIRGIGPSAKNALKTHCKYGHPFDEENTYWSPTGKRACKVCQNNSSTAYRERKAWRIERRAHSGYNRLCGLNSQSYENSPATLSRSYARTMPIPITNSQWP